MGIETPQFEKNPQIWEELGGPKALLKMRQEGFFNQFGIDEDAVCEIIAQYCTGAILLEELDTFFDENNDEEQIGDMHREGAPDEYTITAVGHEAKVEVFKRIEGETGVDWLSI